MILGEARMDILRFLSQKSISYKAGGLSKGGLLSFQAPCHLPSLGPSTLIQYPAGAAGQAWANIPFHIVVGTSWKMNLETGNVAFCWQIYSKFSSRMKLLSKGNLGICQWFSVVYSVCVSINQVLGVCASCCAIQPHGREMGRLQRVSSHSGWRVE